jgi:tetratricopeptide (TPR) repeat protein
MKRKILLMGMVFLIMKAGSCWGADVWLSETFFKANMAYKNGQYQQAIHHYQEILATGYVSGPLLYNLGNTYFKDKQIGKAILNYERARFWMPRDHDLLANTRYVSSLRKDTAVLYQDPLLMRWYKGLIRSFTINELTVLTGVLFVVWSALFLWGTSQGWAGRRLMGWTGVFLVLFLVFVEGHVVQWRQFHETWIVVQDTTARFEPRTEATVHYDLWEGAFVKVLSKEEGWMKIKRFDDKIGWIPAEAIEKIAPDSSVNVKEKKES